jgi:hypothetical protein
VLLGSVGTEALEAGTASNSKDRVGAEGTAEISRYDLRNPIVS